MVTWFLSSSWLPGWEHGTLNRTDQIFPLKFLLIQEKDLFLWFFNTKKVILNRVCQLKILILFKPHNTIIISTWNCWNIKEGLWKKGVHINPLSTMIHLQFLHTDLHIFLLRIVERICLKINSPFENQFSISLV